MPTELDRIRHELSELEAILPRTSPDGPAHARLKQRAFEVKEQIRRAELLEQELRELQKLTAELEQGSPVRRSVEPRIDQLRAELEAVVAGQPEREPQPVAADTMSLGGLSNKNPGATPAAGQVSAAIAFLRHVRAQQIASGLVVLGFFLPWLDFVVHTLSGYDLVRMLLATDQLASFFEDLGGLDEAPSFAAARVFATVFLLIVITSATSCLLPQRRFRAVASYMSNSLLLAFLILIFLPPNGGDAAEPVSIGLIIFGAGVILGVASGAATALDSHSPVSDGRRLQLQTVLAGLTLAGMAAFLYAFEEPLVAHASGLVAWSIAAAVVLIPRAASHGVQVGALPGPSRRFADWWRARRRIVAVVAGAFVFVGAIGGAAVWWYLNSPVEGPLEVTVRHVSGLPYEDRPPGITITSSGQTSSFTAEGGAETLDWSLAEPIQLDVTPPWPSYDDSLTATIDLASHDLGRGADGETLMLTVDFSTGESRVELSRASGAVLESLTATRATAAERREQVEEARRSAEREEPAPTRAAAYACRDAVLATYAPLNDFVVRHEQLVEQHWPQQETAPFPVWATRVTEILNGLQEPLNAAYDAGPANSPRADEQAQQARSAIEDLMGNWLAVRQAANQQDAEAWDAAVRRMLTLKQEARLHVREMRQAAGDDCLV